MSPLPPLSTIGILGSGQLGRMLALAAAEFGFQCHIFCPDPAGPARECAARSTVAAYDDEIALKTFAAECDVITYEFENVPASTVELLSTLCPVRPGLKALQIAQDRQAEKQFLGETSIEIAPWRFVDSPDALDRARSEIGDDSILKTCRMGYDGKGQVKLTPELSSKDAIDQAGTGPYVLEKRIAFDREISIIAARTIDGGIRAYDPAENIHRNHILFTSTVPASVSAECMKKADQIAQTIVDKLEYVGVIGIEMFVSGASGQETILVNEIAPRVHNSGHWTQDACNTSQFEQHIRAITGWPLGDSSRHHDCVMTNLIGDEIDQWNEIAARNDAKLHLYGKAETRPGRKMGHWTALKSR